MAKEWKSTNKNTGLIFEKKYCTLEEKHVLFICVFSRDLIMLMHFSSVKHGSVKVWWMTSFTTEPGCAGIFEGTGIPVHALLGMIWQDFTEGKKSHNRNMLNISVSISNKNGCSSVATYQNFASIMI